MMTHTAMTTKITATPSASGRESGDGVAEARPRCAGGEGTDAG